MEIQGQYLTYVEYKALGGNLSETPFTLLENKARMYVDKYTFGRLIDLEVQEQNTKLCIYYLIENLQNYESSINQSIAQNISSENIDGYSVSYINNASSVSSIITGKEDSIKDIIYTYLANCKLEDGTPYLYRG